MDTTIDRKDEKDNLDCAYDTSDSARAKLQNNTFGEDTGHLVSDDGTRPNLDCTSQKIGTQIL